MTRSRDSATATVYLNGGPEAAFQTYLGGGEHAKPFLGTRRHMGCPDPGKRAARGHGDHTLHVVFFFFFLPLPSKALKVSGVNPARPW